MEVTEKDFSSEFLERFGKEDFKLILSFCNSFISTFPNILTREELLNRILNLKSITMSEDLDSRETGMTEGYQLRGKIICNIKMNKNFKYTPDMYKASLYHELMHTISKKIQQDKGLYGGLYYEGIDEIMTEYYTVQLLQYERIQLGGKIRMSSDIKMQGEEYITYNGTGYPKIAQLGQMYQSIFGKDIENGYFKDFFKFYFEFNENNNTIGDDPIFKVSKEIEEAFQKGNKESIYECYSTALQIFRNQLMCSNEMTLYDYLKYSNSIKKTLPTLEAYKENISGKINTDIPYMFEKQLREIDEEVIMKQLRPDLVGEQTQPDKILQKKQFLAVISTLGDNIDVLTREDIEAVSYGEMSQYTHSNLSCLVINAGTKDFMTFASEDEFRGSSIFKELPEDRAQDIFGDNRSAQYATVPTPRHTWSIIKDENGYIPVQDNLNMEYVQLTGEVDLTGKTIEKTKESSIQRKGQTMNITYDQAEQKEEQSRKRANEKRIEMSSLKPDISSSKIRVDEVAQTQEEIKERKNRRSLLFRAKAGILTAEEQEKLDRLNAKYGEPETIQSKSNGQKRNNGMGR